MGKWKVAELLFHLIESEDFTWKRLKHIDFQDEDVFSFYWDEDYETLDLRIIRYREETDTEEEARLKEAEIDNERRKKMRYETYLKLKEEFGNEDKQPIL